MTIFIKELFNTKTPFSVNQRKIIDDNDGEIDTINYVLENDMVKYYGDGVLELLFYQVDDPDMTKMTKKGLLTLSRLLITMKHVVYDAIEIIEKKRKCKSQSRHLFFNKCQGRHKKEI